MTMLLEPSGELAGHAAVALRRHRQWAATQGLRMPDGFTDLEDAFASRANRGQTGTPMDDLWQVIESRPMAPQLLTYDAAASVLAVSERTVKRLVASGDLNAVRIGGGARIRTADLDAYVAALTPHSTGGAA